MKNTLAFYVMTLRAGFVGYCREELQKIGLSQGLLYFILYVGNHPDCSFTELSGALHADAGHTTRSVEKLVQAGFMERRRLEGNKRMAALKLTEEGQAAYDKAHALFGEWDEEIFTGFKAEEKEQLLNLLEQIGTSYRNREKEIKENV